MSLVRPVGSGPTLDGGSLAEPEHWSSRWAAQRPHVDEGPVYDFDPLLRRFLPRGEGLRCLELGCAPGFVLVHLAKEFGYRVSGVDASARGIEVAREHARLNGVDADLRVGDLFTTTWSAPFDVVYSGGLVEHFADPRPVLRRHLDLLRPGGTLVVSVPNLKGVHRLLLRALDPVDWRRHNPATGSPFALRSHLRRLAPDARVLWCGYWTTFRLYYAAPAPLATAARAVVRGLRAARLGGVGNRWLSPHGWLFARTDEGRSRGA